MLETILIVCVFVSAVAAWYERQLHILNTRLDSALDRIEQLVDVAENPPFNLDPHPTWTKEQIEEWN